MGSMGAVKIRLGMYDEAKEIYQELIALMPNEETYYSNMGYINYCKGEYQEGLDNVEYALQLANAKDNGHSAYAFKNRGLIRVALGDYNEAISDFDQAIELHVDFAEAYYNRAIAKEAIGDSAEAEDDFEKALELDPSLFKED